MEINLSKTKEAPLDPKRKKTVLKLIKYVFQLG